MYWHCIWWRVYWPQVSEQIQWLKHETTVLLESTFKKFLWLWVIWYNFQYHSTLSYVPLTAVYRSHTKWDNLKLLEDIHQEHFNSWKTYQQKLYSLASIYEQELAAPSKHQGDYFWYIWCQSRGGWSRVIALWCNIMQSSIVQGVMASLMASKAANCTQKTCTGAVQLLYKHTIRPLEY